MTSTSGVSTVDTAGFALAGTILTFFGLMHSSEIGVGRSPMVFSAYGLVAILLAACAKYSAPSPVPVIAYEEGHGESASL